MEPSRISTGGGEAVCTVECLGLTLTADCLLLEMILDLVGDTLIKEFVAEVGLPES